MSRIVCISPYRDISLMVQSVAAEIGLDIDVFEGIIGESGWIGDVQTIKTRLEEGAIDVIVSRGGTALNLVRNYDYPVVTISSGPLDLIECCKKAKQFSSNLVITSAMPLVGLGLLENVLGVTITEIVIKELARLRHEVNRRSNRLQAILECANEGIVAIDEEGKIDIFNGAAEQQKDIFLAASVHDISALSADEILEIIEDDDKLQIVFAYCNLHGLWKTEV